MAMSAEDALTKIHKIVGGELLHRKDQDINMAGVSRVMLDMANRLDKIEDIVHKWMVSKNREDDE